jgi:hypothetical protein
MSERAAWSGEAASELADIIAAWDSTEC